MPGDYVRGPFDSPGDYVRGPFDSPGDYVRGPFDCPMIMCEVRLIAR